jgi:hypothetical protein
MSEHDLPPGGANPNPPSSLLWAPLIDTGTLVGALWAATNPAPDDPLGGCTTHLDHAHPRLDWLGQGLAIALRSGMSPRKALSEVRGMGGVRWQLEGTQTADGLDAVRGELMVMDTPAQLEAMPKKAPAKKAARKAPAKKVSAARKAAAELEQPAAE